MPKPGIISVLIGIKGTVIALDRKTDKEIWRTPLKGAGFVNLVLDQGNLIATTKGEVFCLDPATGRVQWNNPLSGMGFGLATIATTDGGSTAVIAEQRRQDEEAAASSSTSATILAVS